MARDRGRLIPGFQITSHNGRDLLGGGPSTVADRVCRCYRKNVTLGNVNEFLSREPPEIIREISPIDPMYAVGPEVYLRAGEEALRCVRLALLAAGKDRVDSLLDFGCAFGRVLRVLKAGFQKRT